MPSAKSIFAAVALLLFCLTLLFAPWKITKKYGANIVETRTATAPIYYQPQADQSTAEIRVEVLVIEWVAIAVLYFGITFICKEISKPEKG